jgi:cysteine desulfurase family protein
MSIYLDNAATSFPKPPEVYTAVDRTLRTIGVAPGRGGYHQGMEAARLVLDVRDSIADFFGVADAARIIFTSNATEALNLGLHGLLQPGDHVITTMMEHNSLARPLHHAASTGVQVTWLPADRCGRITAGQVAAALRPETRLVAVNHCSNVTGSIQPIEEIGDICRTRGILFLVDAAQSAGSLPLQVQDASIDLLAAPGHKCLFGPQGTGFLYVSERVNPAPLTRGGTGSRSADLEQPADLPERYESGTPNTPGIAGLGAGLAFIKSVGRKTIRRHELGLLEQLLAGLTAISGVTVVGPAGADERGAVVSITMAGHDPAALGFRLDHDFGICVRTGLHCAPLAHRAVGTYPAGTVRISPGYFNTPDHIDQLLAALRALAAKGV